MEISSISHTYNHKNMAEEKKQSHIREMTGIVVSDKMKDTIVVAVSRYVQHPKYKKFLKRLKKYHAHDKGNTKVVGDKVVIRECRPISKKKQFIVV